MSEIKSRMRKFDKTRQYYRMIKPRSSLYERHSLLLYVLFAVIIKKSNFSQQVNPSIKWIRFKEFQEESVVSFS